MVPNNEILLKGCFEIGMLWHEYRVELHLSRLIGMVNHLDMHKIQIIGFFFENWLHWQFEVRLLLFTVCTCD